MASWFKRLQGLILVSALTAAITLLSGCAVTPQSSAVISDWEKTEQPSIELFEVPFFPQDKYQCGPAALATSLVFSGVKVQPEELIDRLYVPKRQGSFQVEMLATARRYNRIPYLIEPNLSALVAQLKSGKPVLVMQNLGVSMIPRWHYAVAVGMDTHEETLILRSGTIERRQTPLDVFERTWQRAEHWGLVLLEPGELPAQADEISYFMAVSDFAPNASKQSVTQALNAGLEQWPASKPFNLAVANFSYKEGDIAKAESIYRYLTNSYPGFAPAHNNLASLLLEKGLLKEARHHAEQAVAIGGRFKSEYQSTLDEIDQTR